jgi:glycosyltransferase involved in cell wall biosynthesis
VAGTVFKNTRDFGPIVASLNTVNPVAITISPVPIDLPPGQRLLVIIPAFNEQESLGRVIANIYAAQPQADIVVINDGSSDNTAAIAKEAGAHVVTLVYNLGIGAAMQTGFLFAREGGYDYAVQVDGDGQHDPGEIGEILSPVVERKAEVVAGSRYIEDRGYVTPWPRRLGIIILATLISGAVKRRVTDPTSGFRASNRRAIEYCAASYPADYPEPESVVQFAQAGIRMMEVPVTMNPRYGGQSSITPLRSLNYMVKVVLAIIINMMRRMPKAR